MLTCNCHESIISGLLSWNLAALKSLRIHSFSSFNLSQSSFLLIILFPPIPFIFFFFLLFFYSFLLSQLSHSLSVCPYVCLSVTLPTSESMSIFSYSSDPSLMLTIYCLISSLSSNSTSLSSVLWSFMSKPIDFLNSSNCPMLPSILHHQITIVAIITAFHLRTILSISA